MARFYQSWIWFAGLIFPLHSQSVPDSFKLLIQNTRDDSLLCLLHLDLAMEYVNMQVDSALIYGLKGMELAEASENTYLRAAAHNILGVCYYYHHRPSRAMEHYLLALPLARQSRDLRVLVKTLDNIGIIQVENGQPRQAIERFEESLALYRESQDSLNIGRALLHLGSGYTELDSMEKSIFYTQQALSIFERIGSDFGRMLSTGNIGEALLKTNNWRQARTYFMQSAELARNLSMGGSLSIALMGLAQIANREKYPQEAMRWLAEAEQAVGVSHDQRGILGLLEEKARAYYALRQYPEAQNTLEQRVQMGDSFNRQTYDRQLAELQVEYDIERKEGQITRQALDLEQKNNQILRQRISLGGLAVLLLIMTMGGWVFYRRSRLKQKQELQEAIIHEQKMGLKAVLETQEAEQRRVAKELHDGIAQDLVAAKLGVDLLATKLGPQLPTLQQQIESLSQLIQDTGTQVRQISHTMLPVTLEQQGLITSLEQLLARTLNQPQIAYRFNHNMNSPENPNTSLTLYRLAQEALHNILKHAHASEVILDLDEQGNQIKLTVTDNGRGFDYDKAKAQGTLGLLNMLSRVKNAGGQMQINSAEGLGTKLEVMIPLI